MELEEEEGLCTLANNNHQGEKTDFRTSNTTVKSFAEEYAYLDTHPCLAATATVCAATCV